MSPGIPGLFFVFIFSYFKNDRTVEPSILVTIIQSRRPIALGMTFLATLLCYGLALNGPFFFDDLPNLTQNPLLKIDGLVFDNWRTAMYSSDAGPLRRPISMLSFAANHVAAGGFTSFSVKGVNLVIHLLCGFLVFALASGVFRSPVFRNITFERRRLAAVTAMAIWMLHPLHVSTVLYSVQRMAQLSALFVLFGLWVFLKYRLEWAEKGASAGSVLAAVVWLILITVLASLSKENGALLPWLILVLEVTLFRGILGGLNNRPLACFGWFAFLSPLFLLCLIYFMAPEAITAGYDGRDFNLPERLMTQGRVLWHYMSWLCIPDITAMGFHHDDIAVSRGILLPITTTYAGLAWCLVLFCTFLMRNRFPILLFALLFFLIGHFLESSVLALELVYEHRNYLPSVGVCILLSFFLTSDHWFARKVNPKVIVAGVLCILSLLLYIRADTWSDEYVLARKNAHNHPFSPRANYFISDVLLAKARDQVAQSRDQNEVREYVLRARAHLLRADELSPQNTAVVAALYDIDQQYFPNLKVGRGWLSVLDEALESRIMQSSDYAALSALVARTNMNDQQSDAKQLEFMIDKVAADNPTDVRAVLLVYEYALVSAAPLKRRLELLEHAKKVAPGHPSIEYLLIKEYGAEPNVAAMYEGAREWLVNDPNRYSLPLIKGLFVSPGKTP